MTATFTFDNVVIVSGQTLTVGYLLERGLDRFGRFKSMKVALVSDDPACCVEAVLAAEHVGFELAVVRYDRYTGHFAEVLKRAVDMIFDGSAVIWRRSGVTARELGRAVDGAFLIGTSGTTGTPKIVRHTYKSLNTYSGVHVKPLRWLATYEPGTYAWYQVLVLVLREPGQSLVFPSSLIPSSVAEVMQESQVSSVSATPTFWRYLLASVPRSLLKGVPLKQITLGGERSDQDILDTLKDLYPGASITHIFVTTETGPGFAVADGKEGFPASYLERSLMRGKVEIRIKNGTLWIRSPYVHSGSKGWIDTGDVAVVQRDRVFITGRTGFDTVSVGGNKVSIKELTDFILALQGIIWAGVYAVPARLVGNLVGVELVVDRDVLSTDVEAEELVVSACRNQFPAYYMPRFIKVIDSVPLSVNNKSPLYRGI